MCFSNIFDYIGCSTCDLLHVSYSLFICFQCTCVFDLSAKVEC